MERISLEHSSTTEAMTNLASSMGKSAILRPIGKWVDNPDCDLVCEVGTSTRANPSVWARLGFLLSSQLTSVKKRDYRIVLVDVVLQLKWV